MRLKFAVVGSSILAGAAWALEIPFSVEEPIGAARTLEVASGGIPFPEGKFKDPGAFSLYNGTAEVPVQVSPMVRYPDGSLHWALVSFPVSLKANEKAAFTLKDSPGRAVAANPVVVTEKGDMVEVSNGLVAFVVNKTAFNGFESVKYMDKDVFKAAPAGLTANGKGGPGSPISFSYYYRGPVRTTLYVKGRYGDLKEPTFSMAITLNAGEPAIHIAHSLRNAGIGAVRTTVASPGICLGLAGELQAGASGNSGKSGAFGWQAFTGAADVLVFMRHGGPGNKGVYRAGITNEQFVIQLNPCDGDYGIAEGAHKSTEVDLVFGKAATAAALSEPLHALAACAWYSENDSFGVGKGWGSLADETATYRNAGWTKADDPKKMPREKTDPTLYQSWFEAHATSECDHLQGMVFGYVRTGQRGFLDQAQSWARYWRTYLLWRSDEFIYGKDGRFNTPKWGTARCCTEGCHFYGVGIFNYALITGEVDALEAAYDWAEMAGVAWYGPYAGKKPGDDFSAYGSRGFSRSYLAVVRAYDVARDKQRLDLLLHYVKMATRTPARDPRGFTIGWSGSNPGSAKQAAKGSALVEKMLTDEKVEVAGVNCSNPAYGTYRPKSVGTWPEAMESAANYVAWESLSDSQDPEAQLAAEDAMDYAVAEAYLGLRYAFDSLQKAVHYYMIIDYPIPDFIPTWKGGAWDQYQPKGTDSWYTKWWPQPMAAGYRLTGDKALKDRMIETIWWGLSRDYVGAPSVPEGETPTYSRVEHNTKGDWMTPTALAFGVGAHPREDQSAPAAIMDLKAAAAADGAVQLSWTAPKDEGGGTVARYQVKWAKQPICDYIMSSEEYRQHFKNGKLDVTYWNMAANVLGEPRVPGRAGSEEKMAIQLPAGGEYYVAVRSADDSSNLSALGNVVRVTTK